ncbi:4-demethylwyosine synthase TYW1 [Candidatus Woesearchaeota archaeon]|nr:4-demethylwyosine synthase TYW1 [Candidatus Woesearchaeota archaeon]
MKEYIKFSQEDIKDYTKRNYKLVGKNKHSAVQLCRWTKSKLTKGRNCYKSIYGIKSHRCVQMSPSLDFCSFSCSFCWRPFGKDRFKSENKWDQPEEIIDGMIEAQRSLVSGYGGNSRTTLETFKDANDPVHVAISLDGESTLYPQIAELIREIKLRKMTVFLVTNGTMPNKIKELVEKDAEPDNLSISVYATNKEDYKKITNSFIENEFEKVNESLNLMKEFRTARTIMRTTLVKGLNDNDPEGFAKLINIYKPKFFQIKGYSYLGASKKRLKKTNMPYMEEIEKFAEIISKSTGYIIKTRDDISRVIVMVKDEETWKWNSEKIKEQEERISQRPKSDFTTKKVLRKTLNIIPEQQSI